MTKLIYLRYALLILLITLGAAETQAQTNYKVKKVMIDAGHGGKDPGALGKKSKEKDLTLAIALKLGHYIETNVPDVTVEYTRTTDKFIELGRRAEMANEAKADVFISIHINASDNSKVYGSSTYVNGHAKDEANLAIQKQENGGEDIKPEEYIAFANIQQANHGNSTILAGKIQDQFRTRAGRKDLGVKQACFAVLWRTNMTAVLVECGFISNPSEERYMMSDDGQSYLASAIYRAFKEYKKIVERGTGSTQPHQSADNKTETKPNPKPETKPEEKPQTKHNNESSAADGKIYFRVQVKWSRQPIPLKSKEFKGLKVDEIKIDKIYKYTIGKTQDFNEILAIQKNTREKIKDAFLIATRGNKLIDIKEAKKELGIK